MTRQTVAWTAIALIPAVPFLAFQSWIAATVCPATSRPWCAATVPLSYGWIQREYWSVCPVPRT